ncbi:MAG: phosphoenolpyruvate carboxylase, partial [Pyrinomonadaceae bacterium]
FSSTLAEVVPEVYRDLESTIRETYPEFDVPVPALLSFGSWIGGDRDGNPNVTPQMTAAALALMKDACLSHHEAAIRALGN